MTIEIFLIPEDVNAQIFEYETLLVQEEGLHFELTNSLVLSSSGAQSVILGMHFEEFKCFWEALRYGELEDCLVRLRIYCLGVHNCRVI